MRIGLGITAWVLLGGVAWGQSASISPALYGMQGAQVSSPAPKDLPPAVEKIGGAVSAPVVLSAPPPQFSEEARQHKISGNVLVYMQVNEKGEPVNVRVIRGLGLGLDEKAVEAVKKYKFKPAMKDGHPVTVQMNVEVNFQVTER